MATIRPALPCHVLPCPTGSPQGILQRQPNSPVFKGLIIQEYVKGSVLDGIKE